jgi:thymidylate synthase
LLKVSKKHLVDISGKTKLKKMNKLDLDYQNLLKDILENGTKKETRNGGTISIFGRQIRHKMSDGFPLLTTKKMAWKTMVTELLWFLKGDTNIKYLVDNNCHIWTGDAFRNYINTYKGNFELDKEEFINAIKTSPEFAEQWGELGPIYGAQWRKWDGIDQIQELINTLKANPDSRRMLVSAWNVNYLDEMVLPPCHYGFQVYTRELSGEERWKLLKNKVGKKVFNSWVKDLMPFGGGLSEELQIYNIPKRAISLMWNQRSVDTFLGLPFNIASYGLLLMMLADEVNMVPDELIGNLGDVHLYSNHIEQAKEQIGRELSLEERYDLKQKIKADRCTPTCFTPEEYDSFGVPKRTREPYPLPTVHVRDGMFCSSHNDIILENYQSHPSIKASLSN